MRDKLIFPPNFTMKTGVCTVCLWAFLMLSGMVSGAEESPLRVLVLHGDWHARFGLRTFDQQFVETLSERLDSPVEVSFQNLAIDSSADAATVDFYRQTVNSMIDIMAVDLVVAALPNAIDFAASLDSYMTLPMVLALPSSTDDYTSLPVDRFRVVPSPLSEALRKTLTAATLLHPDASKIEILSGQVVDELGLNTLAKNIVEQEFSGYELIMRVGMSVADIEASVGSLTSDSIVLALPAFSYDPIQPERTKAVIARIASTASQPLYSVADSLLGLGVAGGYFYTSTDYAIATVEAVISLINQDSLGLYKENLIGFYIFDYHEVQRHSLNLDRLAEPYVVINQPSSLLKDYRNTVFASAITFLIFVIVLYLLFAALRKSEAAKEKLQISEREAQQSKIRYAMLTSNTQDVIWSYDEEKLQFIYCSPAIERLTGYTAPEVMQLRISDFVAEGSVSNILRLVFSPDNDSGMFEVEIKRKDGSKIWCEIAVHPIIENNEKTGQWVGVTRDISKRKQEESDRVALEAQLRQSQKFESLGTLAGGIAHDFNNMLGVMMGLNELLKLKVADNPSAVSIIDRIIGTTYKAKGLVGQILAFSRQSDLKKIEFDITELAGDTLDLVQSGILKSVKLREDLGGAPVQVFADANQVSQVLMIILTNAYEALEQEQGEIDFSLKEIDVFSVRECQHGRLEPGRYAKITVSDNGLGVSKDRIEKIFDPFYTSKDLGAGMGLSIARGIVIAHNGGVDFTSLPFKGSTICIYLPAISAPSQSAPQLIDDREQSRSTILLVDDQVDLLETVAMMLDAIGHDCIQCSDPKEAMEIIAGDEAQFDLVITDYSMPDISGLDIANLCAKKRPTTPVILATGYNEPNNFVGEEDERTYAVLQKPFGVDELKTLINKARQSKPS